MRVATQPVWTRVLGICFYDAHRLGLCQRGLVFDPLSAEWNWPPQTAYSLTRSTKPLCTCGLIQFGPEQKAEAIGLSPLPGSSWRNDACGIGVVIDELNTSVDRILAPGSPEGSVSALTLPIELRNQLLVC